MLRSTIAVVAAYALITLWVLASLALVWSVGGESFAFREGSFEVSSSWVILNLVLSVFGAVLGGWVAARIGRGWGPVQVLAGLIFVLAMISAAFQPEKPEPPAGVEVTLQNAGTYARQPAWYPWILGPLGCLGALAGGRIRLRSE